MYAGPYFRAIMFPCTTISRITKTILAGQAISQDDVILSGGRHGLFRRTTSCCLRLKKPCQIECSAQDMNCNNIVRRFRETLVPLSFLVAPALSQVACTGTEQQTPPARAPEPEDEPDGTIDPYRAWCMEDRRRGDPCMTREEFEKRFGGPK